MLCILLLTGCIRVPSLQDLAVVQGIGADYADGRYELTLQLLDTGEGNSTSAAKTVSCAGETVSEALSQTSLSQGMSFFPGHDRVLILGEGTGELELSPLLTELSGSLGLREDVVLLLADGKAADMLNLQPQGALPSRAIEQTVENAAGEGKTVETRLLEAERFLTEGRPVVLPVISLTEEQGFVLSGAEVCSSGERYRLEEDALAGYLFFTDRVRSMNITTGGESVRLFRCRTKLEPELSERSSMLLKIEAEALLPLPVSAVTEEKVKLLEQQTEQQIENCCREIYKISAEKSGEDLLGFGPVIRRYDPEFFRKTEGAKDMTETDFDMEYAVKVDISQYREN